MQLRAVLWDLDGTLTDSSPIIRATLQAVMRGRTGEERDLESLRKYVGPPLYESFSDMGVADDELDVYIADYRARYDEILDQTPVFPGVIDVLDGLRAAGVGTALATSKWESVALNVARHTGLDRHLDIVCGADPRANRHHKHEVIARALDLLEATGVLDPAKRLGEVDLGTALTERDVRHDVVMIGDRDFDTYGAAVHGIRTILVEWGDGSEAEKAGAWAVAATPEQLREILETI